MGKKKPKHKSNSDVQTLGNADIAKEVEYRSGEIASDNRNTLKDDPDFYIGQKPDEIK